MNSDRHLDFNHRLVARRNLNFFSLISGILNAIAGQELLTYAKQSRKTAHKLHTLGANMTPIPLRDDSTRPVFTGRRLLERALVAVHFAPVFKISNQESNEISGFQDAIRSEFPLVERRIENGVRIEMQDDGTVKSETVENTVWRFQDKSRTCTASLTTNSISLDMQVEGYTNWNEFISKMVRLSNNVKTFFSPELVQRTGVRYLNSGRAEGEEDPRNHCIISLRSITGNENVNLADLFWTFDVNEGQLLLRSGVMPPNLSYDGNFFTPRDYKCWYLDIDVVNSSERSFEMVEIESQLFAQAKRLHAIYYWAMPVEDLN